MACPALQEILEQEDILVYGGFVVQAGHAAGRNLASRLACSYLFILIQCPPAQCIQYIFMSRIVYSDNLECFATQETSDTAVLFTYSLYYKKKVRIHFNKSFTKKFYKVFLKPKQRSVTFCIYST